MLAFAAEFDRRLNRIGTAKSASVYRWRDVAIATVVSA